MDDESCEVDWLIRGKRKGGGKAKGEKQRLSIGSRRGE